MEPVAASNQSLITKDETARFTVYSPAVHNVVFLITTVTVGLLQLPNQLWEAHKTTFLCGWVFVLCYAVFRVREAIDVQLRPCLVVRMFGHTSHLFGGLAAILLISVKSVTFGMVLLFLWFLWLFVVVYNIITEIKKDKSEADLPTQIPTV